MANYSKNELVLVRYPFSDLSGGKVRPAVVVSTPHPSQDLLVVPLSSRVSSLFEGEFVLSDWASAGLHVPTAVKRGLYTVHVGLIVKRLRTLCVADAQGLERSLRTWLGL